MNCHQIRKYHLKHNNGHETTPRSVALHMLQCPACQRFCSELETMDALLSSKQPISSPPKDLHEGIIEAVGRERARIQQHGRVDHHRCTRWRRPRAPWVIGGVAATVCLLITWVGMNRPLDITHESSEVSREERVMSSLKAVQVQSGVIGITEQSNQLLALTQADPSGAIYKKEIDELLDFIDANTRILFARHDTKVLMGDK